MPRLPKGELSKTEKGYRVSVGYYAKDGKKTAKVFWLGHDQEHADYLAFTYRKAWRSIVAEGRDVWTDADVAAVKDFINFGVGMRREAVTGAEQAVKRATEHLQTVRTSFTFAAPQAGAARVQTAAAASNHDAPRMLHGAADEWVKHLEARRGSGDLSDDYTARARCTVRNLKLAMPDKPLDEIDAAALDACRLWYQTALATPKAQKGHKAWDTVKTECSQARAMFRWLGEKGWWSEPAKWEKALAPARTAEAEDEREDSDDEYATYSLDELAKLYAAANDNQRLLMLCGLNFAWGQKEIATARKRHWHQLPTGTVKVKRRRHKRARNSAPVYAEWVCWPETWQLAKPRMDRTTDDAAVNPKGRAFLTEDNLPLVRRGEYKTDAIAQSFARLCKTAKVDNRGFYALRRTAIDMVDDIAGESVAAMMGSHRPRSITGKHYATRKWPKLHKALRRLRRRLRPMFVGPEAPVAV
jgi:integrase